MKRGSSIDVHAIARPALDRRADGVVDREGNHLTGGGVPFFLESRTVVSTRSFVPAPVPNSAPRGRGRTHPLGGWRGAVNHSLHGARSDERASERPRAPPGPDGVPAGSPRRGGRFSCARRRARGARDGGDAARGVGGVRARAGLGGEHEARDAVAGDRLLPRALPGAETGLGAPPRLAPPAPPSRAAHAARTRDGGGAAPRGPRANRRGRRAAWDVLGDVAEYETTLRAKTRRNERSSAHARAPPRSPAPPPAADARRGRRVPRPLQPRVPRPVRER